MGLSSRVGCGYLPVLGGVGGPVEVRAGKWAIIA